MPLVAWQPYSRARHALELLKATAPGSDAAAWRDLEDAIADLGQIAITIEELRDREGKHHAR